MASSLHSRKGDCGSGKAFLSSSGMSQIPPLVSSGEWLRAPVLGALCSMLRIRDPVSPPWNTKKAQGTGPGRAIVGMGKDRAFQGHVGWPTQASRWGNQPQ